MSPLKYKRDMGLEKNPRVCSAGMGDFLGCVMVWWRGTLELSMLRLGQCRDW